MIYNDMNHCILFTIPVLVPWFPAGGTLVKQHSFFSVSSQSTARIHRLRNRFHMDVIPSRRFRLDLSFILDYHYRY